MAPRRELARRGCRPSRSEAHRLGGEGAIDQVERADLQRREIDRDEAGRAEARQRRRALHDAERYERRGAGTGSPRVLIARAWMSERRGVSSKLSWISARRWALIAWLIACASPASAQSAELSGTIDAIDGAREVVMVRVGDSVREVRVERQTLIVIAGQPGTLADLRPGQSVLVRLQVTSSGRVRSTAARIAVRSLSSRKSIGHGRSGALTPPRSWHRAAATFADELVIIGGVPYGSEPATLNPCTPEWRAVTVDGANPADRRSGHSITANVMFGGFTGSEYLADLHRVERVDQTRFGSCPSMRSAPTGVPPSGLDMRLQSARTVDVSSSMAEPIAGM